jgi:hypothetical protein
MNTMITANLNFFILFIFIVTAQFAPEEKVEHAGMKAALHAVVFEFTRFVRIMKSDVNVHLGKRDRFEAACF